MTAIHELTIENDRLLMHPLRDADLDGLKRMIVNPIIYRYEPTFLPELQGTPEEALAKIMSLDLEKNRVCILGIYEKAAPETLVGLLEFYDYKLSGNIISVGYRLAEEYWGRGIASSCVSAVIEFLRANTEVKMVTAHAIPDNIASAKVLTKNGFVYLHTKEEDWGREELTVADIYALDLE